MVGRALAPMFLHPLQYGEENLERAYIEISSWEVLTYGIYARVNLFRKTNERVQRASEF